MKMFFYLFMDSNASDIHRYLYLNHVDFRLGTLDNKTIDGNKGTN